MLWNKSMHWCHIEFLDIQHQKKLYLLFYKYVSHPAPCCLTLPHVVSPYPMLSHPAPGNVPPCLGVSQIAPKCVVLQKQQFRTDVLFFVRPFYRILIPFWLMIQMRLCLLFYLWYLLRYSSSKSKNKKCPTQPRSPPKWHHHDAIHHLIFINLNTYLQRAYQIAVYQISVWSHVRELRYIVGKLTEIYEEKNYVESLWPSPLTRGHQFWQGLSQCCKQSFSETRVKMGASVRLEFCWLTDRQTDTHTYTHTHNAQLFNQANFFNVQLT